MALLLAPYNSAMRLGMGFNSYTQQLCVNDVVRKPGNLPATESDLRAAQLTQIADKARDNAPVTTSLVKPPDGKAPTEVLEGASGIMTRTVIDGQKEVSQVVSWTASFIENSSDVLQKLDVSGSLAIKMDGLGSLTGKAAFVDSTDIKKADINYLIHVKVTNQRLVGDNITQFSPIPYVEPGQFTDIYGDCFISGFIEGGEFDAVVSITTEQTIKKWGLSGSLELSANIAGIDVAGSVSGGKDDNSTTKGARTKISVTWSGGGDIRPDSIQEWTLSTLKQVAMSFPDAVAACPQRTSAILTKYTSLRSFHESTKKGSPLDYENAGVYTSSLYDAYTDYKMMWTEIQALTKGLNTKQIELFMAKVPAGLKKFAEDIKTIQEQKKADYKRAVEESKKQDALGAVVAYSQTPKPVVPLEKPLDFNALEPYAADIFGLEVAARDCRFEMIKIVREVDAVTNDPHVASDPSRTTQFLSPSIFRLLVPSPYSIQLPTMLEWTNTTADLTARKEEVRKKEEEIAKIKKTLEAALITPKRGGNARLASAPFQDTSALHHDIQTSLSRHAYRADDYRMQTLLQRKDSISTGASFFNDLDDLPSSRPQELRFWADDTTLRGIRVTYPDGTQISHGKTVTPKGSATAQTSGKTEEASPKAEAGAEGVTASKPSESAPSSDGSNESSDVVKLNEQVFALGMDEVITEIDVYSIQGPEDKPIITGVVLATSKCNIFTAGVRSGNPPLSFSMSDDRQWSFRGFFGFTFTDTFQDLGVVWGQDKTTPQSTTVQVPPAKNLLKMSAPLQAKTKLAMAQTKPTEHFYMGDSVSTGTTSDPTQTKSFSVVDDISGTDTMTHIAFSVSSHRLSGLKVGYGPSKQVTHGAYSEDQKVWECKIEGPVIAAKLTTGKKDGVAEPFVDAVELVCGNADGSLPLWPLDVSTVRYLGDFPDDAKPDVHARVTEQAPKFGGANWTLRGFYGEVSRGIITRLGLVWGCA